MSNIYGPQQKHDLDVKISEDVSFFKRMRNRLVRWWVPTLMGAALLGGLILSVATANIAGITAIINIALYQLPAIALGGLIAHAFSRSVLFRKRCKRAKQENKIHKLTKKSKKRYKKIKSHQENYKLLAENANRIIKTGLSHDENFGINRKRLFKNYVSTRRRIDKVNLKLAKDTLKLENVLTGKTYGPVKTAVGAVPRAARKIFGMQANRGLELANEKYKLIAETTKEKKRDRNWVFGKFKYSGNVLEAQKRVRNSHAYLKEIAETTRTLDGEIKKVYSKNKQGSESSPLESRKESRAKEDKGYVAGRNFMQRAYRKIRHFDSDPNKVIEKISARPVNFSEEVYNSACQAVKDKRFIWDEEKDLKSATKNKENKSSGTQKKATNTKRKESEHNLGSVYANHNAKSPNNLSASSKSSGDKSGLENFKETPNLFNYDSSVKAQTQKAPSNDDKLEEDRNLFNHENYDEKIGKKNRER